MSRLSKRFPSGLQYQEAFNTTTAVRESIREVLKTLAIAILIVIVVIFFFLQTWRSHPDSRNHYSRLLIGAFAFVKLFNFSINTLTLFGITLATGLVVDDAIVVIENVERHLEEGIHDARRHLVAMSEVTSAVIATSIVLIAVFVPVSLFPEPPAVSTSSLPSPSPSPLPCRPSTRLRSPRRCPRSCFVTRIVRPIPSSASSTAAWLGSRKAIAVCSPAWRAPKLSW